MPEPHVDHGRLLTKVTAAPHPASHCTFTVTAEDRDHPDCPDGARAGVDANKLLASAALMLGTLGRDEIWLVGPAHFIHLTGRKS